MFCFESVMYFSISKGLFLLCDINIIKGMSHKAEVFA